ncbi:MAG: hypothetical protein WBQ25_22240 [Nitrososphaeraceae archaeon]
MCDGFWLFIKPLEVGNHTIYFKGETLLTEPYSKSEMRKATVYSPIWKDIDMNQPFKVEVLYELAISDEDGI